MTEAIRDAVHKWIKFSTQEKNIIDSPFVQRLRWISQLTSADHVFPGGTHNRFIHSLGAMHIAGKYMRNLFKNTKLPEDPCEELKKIWQEKDKYIQMARIAALLHDVGHGPFSHAYDRSIYKKIYNIDDGGHDIHRLEIIKSPLLAPLVEKCGVSIEDIILCWTNPPTCTIYEVIHNVVQGPLGADRIDFTLRDSYFTGTEHLGTISPQRIISNSFISISDTFNLNLTYRTKALSDIIQALDGRFRMYDCVYLHRTVFASGILIEQMMKKAYICLNLIERTKDLDSFLMINDHTIIGEIISSTSEEMEKARKYCRAFLLRELPSLISEEIIQSSADMSASKIKKQEGCKIVKTKEIGPINPVLFDKIGIHFLDKDNKIITCKEALECIKYIPSQDPFYYIRIYKL